MQKEGKQKKWKIFISIKIRTTKKATTNSKHLEMFIITINWESEGERGDGSVAIILFGSPIQVHIIRAFVVRLERRQHTIA